MPVTPFDGAGVDIVASLHLADGIMFCTCCVFRLCTKKVILSSIFLIIPSFSYLFIFSFILVSCLNWLSIMCGGFLS